MEIQEVIINNGEKRYIVLDNHQQPIQESDIRVIFYKKMLKVIDNRFISFKLKLKKEVKS